MIRNRILVTVAVATLAVLGLPSPADAGETVIGIDAQCNDETGEYDVTIMILNSSTDAGTIVVNDYQVDGVNETPPTFVPNPLPSSGSSEATTSVPGTTTAVLIDVQIQYPLYNLDLLAEEPVDGDCQPAPTTTTTVVTTTTVAATTQAPAAQPVEQTPTFTG